MKLVSEDNKLLKTKCREYEFGNSDKLEELVAILLKFMYDKNGIGLAAPQVGLDYRIIVLKEKPFLMINPDIISVSKEKTKETEACLSFPNLFLNVERYNTIVVTYQNIRGEYITEEYEGFIARVIQHEIDHINGITFRDRVSKLALDIAERKRKNFYRRTA